MKIAYFDCIAGASGDMLLSSLIDAGVDYPLLVNELKALHIPGYEIDVNKIQKQGLSATHINIRITDHRTERHLREIEEIIINSHLAEGLKEDSLRIIRKIAFVEAEIHGLPVEQVHLHELGGIDTILDIVGTLIALNMLRIEMVYSSPLPLGRGFIMSAHGKLPLPSPATVKLLVGAPVIGSDIDMELVTPTGAAILSTLVESYGPIPPMHLLGVGYGAGTRDLPLPNILRVFIGEVDLPSVNNTEVLSVIESNIDDQNPEFYEYVTNRLFSAGALDVTLIPIYMKKNRPATMVQVLCRIPDTEKLSEILFSETTTLGIRQHLINRSYLNREIKTIETPYGSARIKIAYMRSGDKKITPEYEDCKILATNSGLPLRNIYDIVKTIGEKEYSS